PWRRLLPEPMRFVQLEKNGSPEVSRVFLCANIVIVVAFSLIFSRLWYLQVVRGEYFKGLSETNRIRIQEIAAPRGILFDRNGVPLVDSFPSFDVSLFRQDVPDIDALIPDLARALSLDPEKLEAKLEAAKGTPLHQPVKIKTDITREDLANVETRKLDLPGVVVDVVIRRNYPYKELASHIIGYLGEISQDELEKDEFANHKLGYLVGKYGIEQKFELDLMGENGGRQIEVNAMGQKIRLLGQVEPNPGNNLYLTLDVELQKAAEEAMAGKNGAVVAVDPQNGDILAMVSKPNFDPNLFARGINPESWKTITDNPLHPLQNRAIQGQYPPGSVFKIIMAIAALEEKVITPETAFHCGGSYHYGNRDYRCWKKEGHGGLSLRRALVESCDVYFYNVGMRLGVNRIAKYASEAGLGRPTGFPLGREKPGLVPTSAWKLKRFGIPWQLGENLSISIGQGYNLATPLQIACSVSALFNGGKYYQPRIVRKIGAPHGEVLKEIPPVVLQNVEISPQSIDFVREALWGVVNSPGGTGSRARVEGFNVAGKTGTSQVVQRKGDKFDTTTPEFQDHAVFACFAPAPNPEIAVAVLVEHGGGGGANAAPVAKQVLETYYKKTKKAPAPSQIASEKIPGGEEG
ncbi:MAG TPA: penicillin-binding protein 2, partial [Thermodesulfobacteriota bacterium]|nr:penicillin-binding protein 2 [Thermodesulfobacteriota bacterium]